MIILAGGMQDVEQQEVSQPLRYLWRREVPDSGGPGRYRGGNGIEYALTPIDTDEITGVLATHGVKQPLRTGLFGGLPGCVARYEIVRGSDLAVLDAKGRPPQRLDEAGGRYEALPALSTNLPLARGDVVNVRMHNGGGYGDPLLRDPQRVLRDVQNGSATKSAAHDIYGVVTREGSVDEAATEARRKAIRVDRKARMLRPARVIKAHGDRRRPVSIQPWGDSLFICRYGDAEGEIRCAHCEHCLGALGEDWRDGAGVVRLAPAELGPLVEVVDALAARQYVCPNCAIALWVQIGDAKHPSAADFPALHWAEEGR